ncbi:hypothetical protein BSK48_30320 [Paenibacillus odorifer]|nr:hypothetical protein BSK48_30320 [Paenibacillus odorifer]
MIGYTDPANHLNDAGITTSYSYDALNRLTSVYDALNQRTRYTYDGIGQLAKVTVQAKGGAEQTLNTKSYNEVGLLTSKLDGASQSESLSYNALGQLTSKTDRNGSVFNYSYDEIGGLKSSTVSGSINNVPQTQKTELTYSDGSPNLQTTKTYLNGTMKAVQSSSVNSLNQVRSMSGTVYPSGVAAHSAYILNQRDALGRMTQLNDSYLGFYVNYQYNKTRLDKVQTNGSSVVDSASAANVQYVYSANNLVKFIIYPTLTDGSVLRTEYAYNKALNWVESITNQKGSSVLSRYVYGYDNNGNVISIKETKKDGTEQTTTFAYDALNRLIATVHPGGGRDGYTYDVRGNRLTMEQSVGDPVASFEDTSYSYDLWNTLTSVTKNGSETRFEYYGDGLRAIKSKGSTHTQVNYDLNGQVITEEKLNGNNIVQKSTYVRGDRVLVKKDKTASKDYYYLYNGHGDVVQMVDTSGAVVNSYAYDVWGNITSQKEETPNPFKYTGEVYDEETGLYYLRARYYDPSMGRFLNEDTYEGQIDNPLSLNLYTYVENNPLMYTDPSGHAPIVGDSPYDTAPTNTVKGYIVYVTENQLTQLGFQNVTNDMLKDLNITLGMFDITTSDRISHFLAQVMQESELGRWTTELGGKKYFSKYEPGTKLGKQLGNKDKGDGYKFRGAGYIQMTGRYNYQRFADAMDDQKIMELGAEYVAENYAWRAAGFWWDDNNMNELVDSGASVEKVTRRVNGGTNHLANRQKYYALTKKVIR